MPSAVIEQIRQQFYTSMGINDWTPISEDQAPMLIDQWEQYLYSVGQQNTGGPYPPAVRPVVPPPVSYVPPNQRNPYTPAPYVPGSIFVPPSAPSSRIGPAIPIGIRPVAIAPLTRGSR